MRKLVGLLVMLLTVAGCEKLETALGSGPVGRYQIATSCQADGAANTFILDTKHGTAWRLRENDFWPIPVVKSDAAKRNAELKAKLADLEEESRRRGIPVTGQGVTPQSEKGAIDLEDKEAQLKALTAEIAREKAKRGVGLTFEELMTLPATTATDIRKAKDATRDAKKHE